MSTFTSLPTKSFISTAAIEAYVRVKLDGTTANSVVVAGATEVGIGVTEAPVGAGDPVSVRLFTSTGSAYFRVGAAVAIHSQVRAIADGEVDDSGAGPIVGTALSAGTGDGSVIEVLLGGSTFTALAAAAQAAVVASSVDGAAAAVNSTAVAPVKTDFDALLAVTETIGDDARAAIVLANALRTALISAGIITGAA